MFSSTGKGLFSTLIAGWAGWAVAHHLPNIGSINGVALVVAVVMVIWAGLYLALTKFEIKAAAVQRTFAVLAAVVMSSSMWLTTLVSASAPNMIANASVETAAAGNTAAPADWQTGVWGKNTTSFSYLNGGASDGTRALRVDVSGYGSGDAKWFFNPVAVTVGQTYTFADDFRSSTSTMVIARFETAAAKYSYSTLGNPVASSNWKSVSYQVKPTTGTVKMTVFHLIKSNGWLETDNFALNGPALTPTPSVSPTTSVTPSPTVKPTTTPTMFPTATPTVSPTTTPSSTPSATPTATPKPTATPTVTPSTTPSPTPTPTPSVCSGVVNCSLETTDAATGAPQGWTQGTWGANATAFSYLSTGHTGSRSVKISQTNYTSGDAKWVPTVSAVTAGQTYVVSDWYQSDVTTKVTVKMETAAGAVSYDDLGMAAPSSVWAQFTATQPVPAGVVKMTVLHIIAANGYLVTDDYNLGVYAPVAFNRSLISLTFDDGWENQYTYALPLLQKYQTPSTFYLISGAFQWGGYLQVAEAVSLRNAGNELAAHTQTHPDLTTLSQIRLTNELLGGQTDLSNLLGGTFQDFASPYGAYNDAVIAEIKKYYRSHRSTDVGFNSRDNLNIYNIKVQNVYLSTTSADVQSWVDQAKSDHTWLVIVYHQVDPNAVMLGKYAITDTQMEDHLKIVKASGLPVVTVDSALNELIPQLAN
jgi:peptidoglycan/xylan/chitin deacetylase (PgdA/CDA1 family)